MTTQIQPQVISLSAELARPDDDVRHQSALRWRAALHRLSLLRAAANETTYEAEWARIFDPEALLADVQRSRLLSFAALDVLEVQHEHTSTVFRMEGLAFDEERAEVCRELIVALRFKVENHLA